MSATSVAQAAPSMPSRGISSQFKITFATMVLAANTITSRSRPSLTNESRNTNRK